GPGGSGAALRRPAADRGAEPGIAAARPARLVGAVVPAAAPALRAAAQPAGGTERTRPATGVGSVRRVAHPGRRDVRTAVDVRRGLPRAAATLADDPSEQ